MTANSPTNINPSIKSLLDELEASIAGYPEDLRDDYAQSKTEFRLDEDEFDDKDAQVKELNARELVPIHQLMFASAFAASASSLVGRDIAESPIKSTSILDAVTEAGLPAREFLRCYGKYGNHFTWKLMKLTGRISENSNQIAPDLVKGA